MALVSVAFVMPVRKDAHDDAIWTVLVVSHPVMIDHRHRYSLELVSVEALEVEIVVVIAHVIHFQLLLFLSHFQVQELGSGGPGRSKRRRRCARRQIGLEQLFMRSTQAVDSPLAAKMSNSCPKVP